MAKSSPKYVCQSCGAEFPKWSGKCDGCGAWNSLAEDHRRAAPLPGTRGAAAPTGRAVALSGLDADAPAPERIVTGIGELDRVCGGGLVPGSGILIGGDPGIGKSTLLTQALASLARGGQRAIYISGEEALDQVRLRARRLSLSDAPLLLAAETNVADILATVGERARPAVVVIDSIQTLWSPALESAPGTVSQLRACVEALVRCAKQLGLVIVFVGHVTKDGQIAGPKVVEHMVDTVLYFEGDRGHSFRILRAVKNRFGPTDEIGVFEMSDGGLKEVVNPSKLFMAGADAAAPGSAVFAGIEGTRPLLMEVQALVSPSPLGTPRRSVVGWDQNRLAMVLAVLEAHGGVSMAQHDVYLNVAGGLRVREPAADLAVAAALVSSLSGRVIPQSAAVFGEIALSGALRPVGQSGARVREAEKLGLDTVVLAGGSELNGKTDMAFREMGTVADLVAYVAGLGAGAPGGGLHRAAAGQSPTPH